jgi:ATPase subunit of ABC transporter with duplicated ATPase domains
MRLFDQHHADSFKFEDTPVEHMRKAFPASKPHDVRQHLGAYGLGGELAVKRIELLSGGQKTRLSLAEITFACPHILFLDEPSNHLDYESIHALTCAIQEFEGVVILASHDQWLLDECAETLYIVENQRVVEYDGAMEDYVEGLLRRL